MKKAPIKPLDWLLICILAAVFVLDGVTVWNTSLHLLDCDASAEMVLSKHLSETGHLLSKDWFYSTEIRAVHSQLIFAPLFSIFSDWSMVRFLGTMLWHVLLLVGYGIFIKSTKGSLRAFLLGGSLLLLPISVAYGRIVLYHTYYIVFIIFGFVLTGLFSSLLDNRCKRTVGFYVRLMLLLLLSFVSCLNGYRQLALTFAPLGLMAVCRLYRSQTQEDTRTAFTALLLVGMSIVAGGAGLMINQAWHVQYSFINYSGIELTVISPKDFFDMIFGLFHQFGYRRGIPLVSRMGLLSIAGIAAGLYCLICGYRTMLCKEKPEPIGQCITFHMLPCSLTVILLIFIFTRQSTMAELYFIPFAVWFIPFLATKAAAKRSWDSLLILALCGVCALNGIVNTGSFRNLLGFGQNYEGLTFKRPAYAMYLEEPVKFLCEKNYDLGYALLFDGNVAVELSDGQFKIVNLVENNNELHNYEWLTLRSSHLAESKKPFLLLPYDGTSSVENETAAQFLQRVWEGSGYVIYDIIDLPGFRTMIDNNRIV